MHLFCQNCGDEEILVKFFGSCERRRPLGVSVPASLARSSLKPKHLLLLSTETLWPLNLSRLFHGVFLHVQTSPWESFSPVKHGTSTSEVLGFSFSAARGSWTSAGC